VGIASNNKVKKAVFLDRDGVLNEAVVQDGKPYPPTDVASLRIIPGTREALIRLKKRGYLLLMTTNQPDVARGTQAPRDRGRDQPLLTRRA
jgi:D-glycero-D-manno-heptose 1,7-bisphosphate phosphatase